MRLRAGDTTIEVAALAPDLFRVGVFPRAKPPRYDTGGVANDDWPAHETEWTGGELRTAEATAHVELDPLRISFSDASGRRFAADDPGVAIEAGASRPDRRPPRPGDRADEGARAGRALLRLRRAHRAASRRPVRTRCSGTSTRRTATPRR